MATLLICSPLLGQEEEEADPPEIAIGERLFLETRFAQAFKAFVDNGGEVNAEIAEGDPALDETATTGAPLTGIFAGQSFNCRACHLVDEHLDEPGGGMRTYTDFARRSPVPVREDGALTAVRNSPPLVNASQVRPGGTILHFDGEFNSMEDLVRGTLSGRNFGWLPGEGGMAAPHVARIIREDDGSGELAGEFGEIPYAALLSGTDSALPSEFVLGEEFRVDVGSATDSEIFDAVAKLIAAYTSDLAFSADEKGRFNRSPYDAFLMANGLPRAPADGESPLAYSRRLLRMVQAAEQAGGLQFVSTDLETGAGAFEFHDQGFRFGHRQLLGMKTFFAEPKGAAPTPLEVTRGGLGGCIRCHAAPLFTDFRFHNTGVTQTEYDAIHGGGAFAMLAIPNLADRNGSPALYLPATNDLPAAAEPFRRIASAEQPGWTDLGVWNIFGNPAMPGPQGKLWRAFCEPELLVAQPGLAQLSQIQLNRLLDSYAARDDRFFSPCTEEELLPKTVAAFKTAGLRDLSHSAPYMHNGAFDTLTSVLAQYQNSAAEARTGQLRNAGPEMKAIAIIERDFRDLVLFLHALNEDYN